MSIATLVDLAGDDTIILGGENIAPAQIEDVLVGHDAEQRDARPRHVHVFDKLSAGWSIL
jgi:acyl-CoA synthetase (AMP-forming)/AMP-acid ligase II